MIEKNRNILSNALKDMPVRSPKATNWDHISNDLDQIETSAFISETKSKLPKHKAPEDAWANIASGLASPASSFFNSLTGRLITASVLLGGIIGAYFLFTSPSPLHNEIEEQIPVPEVSVHDQAKEVQQHEINAKVEVSELSQANDAPQNEIIFIPASNGPDLTQNTQEPRFNNIVYFNDDNSNTRIKSGEKLNKLEPVPPGQLTASAKNNKKPRYYTSRSDKSYSDYYMQDPSKPKFKFGIFYSYKQFQDIDQEGMDIPQHLSSFGIDLYYETHKWFFKTGLEYLSWEEKGNYTFDYDQNQMIYQYNYVDSVLVNTGNNQITYYTSEKQVFDSIPLQKSDQVIYNYQILQIPILIGYKLVEHSKFNLAIIGGIGCDLRISGKQFTPVFNEESSTITDINNSLEYRSNINWRLIGGVEIDYILTNKWGLYAEPTYQQYMKPLYVPNTSKGVGLFSIKVGIKYSF